MGYMELSLVGSDTASGMAYSISKAIVAELEKRLDDDNGPYNTAGVINAAMFVDECLVPSEHWRLFGHQLHEFCQKRLLPKLGKFIEACEKAEWNTEENKREHLQALNRLRRRVARFADPDEEEPKSDPEGELSDLLWENNWNAVGKDKWRNGPSYIGGQPLLEILYTKSTGHFAAIDSVAVTGMRRNRADVIKDLLEMAKAGKLDIKTK